MTAAAGLEALEVANVASALEVEDDEEDDDVTAELGEEGVPDGQV